MAHEQSLFPAVNHTATLEARSRRILSITATCFGLVPAKGLARQGKIVILRHGKPADPEAFKGVYRLRLP